MSPLLAPLELIVAMAENGVIGRDNALPWHLKADLKHFKAVTLGHAMLMGRRTWESIGRPLPGRRSLVLTRHREYVAPGASVVSSLEAARAAATLGAPLMVIGGAEVFALCLGEASVLHLTLVHASVEGDVRFPPFSLNDWRETRRVLVRADAGNDYDFSILRLERR